MGLKVKEKNTPDSIHCASNSPRQRKLSLKIDEIPEATGPNEDLQGL